MSQLRFTIVALELLLLVAECCGQTIALPETIQLGQPIVAEYEFTSTATTELVATWQVDEASTFEPHTKPGKLRCCVWAAPGDHWVKLSITIITFEMRTVLVPDPASPTDVSKAKPSTIKSLVSVENKEVPQRRFRVTTGGEAPRPPPDPPIPPTPTAKSLLLVVIDDVNEPSGDTSIVLNSAYWLTDLKALGHRGIKYHNTTTERIGKEHVKRAGNKPLPALLVYDVDRETLLDVVAFPATVAGLQSVVKQFTGR